MASAAIRVRAFGATHVGQVRERNEDSFLVDDQLNLYIVCDGMGGHAAGEVASENAARFVASYLRERHAQISAAANTPEGYYRVLRLAEGAVEYASSQLYQMACSEPECSGMGTTLTLLLIVGNKGVMAHVGDSRLYLSRAGNLHQLSQDHTLVNELVQKGMLSAEDGSESPYGHILTRSIGPHDAVEVETLMFDLLPGDVFLLCSDGLTRYLDSEAEILALVDREVNEESARQFIESANCRGGADNITAIVVELQAAAGAAVLDAAEFEHRLNILKSVFLFQGLSLSRLMRVINIAASSRHRPGDRIMPQGEICHQLCVVLRGQVSYGSKTYAAGDCFGAQTLFCKQELHSDLVADEATQLLSIQGDDFQSLTRRVPRLGRRLLTQLARYLSKELQIAGKIDEDMDDTWTE